jgi:hypothetical protein
MFIFLCGTFLFSVNISAAIPSFKLTTFSGTGIQASSGDDGPAKSADISSPIGIWQNSDGTLFIAESSGNRVRAISASSDTISTYAGNGTAGSTGDNDQVRNSTKT